MPEGTEASRVQKGLKAWAKAHPAAVLAGLWAAAELVYLLGFTLPYFLPRYAGGLTDLAGIDGRSDASLAWFLAKWAVLFALYLLAWRWAPKLSTLTPVFLGAALFGATLLFMYPVTAIDIYNYFVRGRLFTVHGLNPYLVPPGSVADEPLTIYAGGWGGITTPYGPLWTLVTGGLAWAGGPSPLMNLLLLKVLALDALLACGLLVAALASPPQQRAQAALFFLWNPLVLFEVVGNGHNDVFLMLPVLGALLLMRRNWHTLAAGCLALSVAVKFVTAVLGPLFLLIAILHLGSWRARARYLAGSAALVGITVFFLLLPFWAGLRTFQQTINESRYFLLSLPSVLLLLLERMGAGDPARTATLISLGVFLAVYLWRLPSGLSGDTLLQTSTELVLALLLVATTNFKSWYVVWVVPLAALCLHRFHRWATVGLCLGAQAAVGVFAYLWDRHGLTFHALNGLGVGLIVGGTALGMVLAALTSLRPRALARSPSAPPVTRS